MRLLIDILSGYASPWHGEFEQDEVTVGRADDADVRLHPTKDTICAREVHARFVRRGRAWRLTVDHPNGVTLTAPAGERRFLAAGESMDLTETCELLIGKNGPRLAVTVSGGALPSTLRSGAERVREEDLPIGHVTGSTVRAAERSGRRVAVLAGLTVLAVIAIVVALVLVRSRSRQEVESVFMEMGDLEARTEGLLSNVQKEQQAWLRKIEKGSTDEMPAILGAAADSVVLVGFMDSTGGFTPFGTAWTVAERRLATNAHIARELLNARSAGLRCVARRGPALAELIEIGDITMHPAYEPWSGLLSLQMQRVAGGINPVHLVPVCDVALLEVPQGNLGAPLRLATDDAEEFLLRPGEAVGYVGFPLENVAGLPSQQLVVGHVTAITDFFFQTAQWKDCLLIHHDAIATGGASGSPLLNRRGDVVGLVSAGNVVGTAEGRVPIGLNYAQRVDLLQELIEGRAETAQREREAEWRDRLERLFVLPAERIETLVQDRSRNVLGLEVELVHEEWADLVAGDTAGHQLTIDADAGRLYGFYASCMDWSNVDIRTEIGGQVIAQDILPDGMPEVWIPPLRTDLPVNVFVFVDESRNREMRALVRVYRATP